MVTSTLRAAFFSIQSAKAGTVFGQLAFVPLSGTAHALARVAFSPDIPREAVVTKADLTITFPSLAAGRAFTLRENLAGFTASNASWTKSPAFTATETAAGVSTGAVSATFSVIPYAQGVIAGTRVNHGWRLWGSGTGSVRGAINAVGQPSLKLEYALPGVAPFDLTPAGGAVSIAKPVLQFNLAGEMTALQIQVDPDADFTSVAWDSGTLLATAGLLDLATTTYPGLAVGATTTWRARAQTSFGWSDWSDAVSFSRQAKPTVAITAPATTTGDTSPPVQWTVTGGTQTASRVRVLDVATNKEVAASALMPGASMLWTPPSAAYTSVGQVRRFVVEVYDAVDREATPGDPSYATATRDVTLVTSGVAAGVTTLTAVSRTPLPGVTLTWTGTTPDEWQIQRGDKVVTTVPGVDRSYVDLSGKPEVPYVYKVLPVSNGVVSPNGPTPSATSRPLGTWLIDPASGKGLVLWSVGNAAFAMVEQAALHQIAGDAQQTRRRGGITPPSGALGGTVADAAGTLAADSLSALRAFKLNDPGTVYRLVVGQWSIPVTIGDVDWSPDPESMELHAASFSWWQIKDELPWND